jgi:hypothetical protein
MSGWQPITTAPKDGTVILTFQANSMSGPKVKVISWREDTVPKGWGETEVAPTASSNAAFRLVGIRLHALVKRDLFLDEIGGFLCLIFHWGHPLTDIPLRTLASWQKRALR